MKGIFPPCSLQCVAVPSGYCLCYGMAVCYNVKYSVAALGEHAAIVCVQTFVD